jgi:hypothetical protein
MVARSNDITDLRPVLPQVLEAIGTAKPGTYVRVAALHPPAPVCQQAKTSRDACQVLRRSRQARRSSFVSEFRFSVSAPGSSSMHQTPIGDLDRSALATPCPRNTSVPSLVQSKKVELALRPVGSGRERGAELLGGTLFGAPRMFGGEVGSQSRLADAGHVPRSHPRDSWHLAVITDLRISSMQLNLALPSVLFGTWLQLDGWFTHPRSSICCGPRSAPCRRRAPCSA